MEVDKYLQAAVPNTHTHARTHARTRTHQNTSWLELLAGGLYCISPSLLLHLSLWALLNLYLRSGLCHFEYLKYVCYMRVRVYVWIDGWIDGWWDGVCGVTICADVSHVCVKIYTVCVDDGMTWMCGLLYRPGTNRRPPLWCVAPTAPVVGNHFE